MNLLVRAFPVLPGKEADLRSFANALQTKRASEAVAFYRSHGVARESWHLQQTAAGASMLIAVTQIPDRAVVEAAQDYAAAQGPFDRWFKEQVKVLTGIDPDKEPLGPPTDCVYDTATFLPMGSSA